MEALERARQLFYQALELIQDECFKAAEPCLREAADLAPERVSVLINLSAVLFKQKKITECQAVARRALELERNNVQAWEHLCACLVHEKKFADALALVDQALTILPDASELWVAKGAVLAGLNRREAALVCIDRAIQFDANQAAAWCHRGIILRDMNRLSEALAAQDKALLLDSGLIEARFNRACILHVMRRHTEAAQAYQDVLVQRPGYRFAMGELLHSRMLGCDWHDFSDLTAALNQAVCLGVAAAEPFGYQAVSESIATLRRCAEVYVAEKFMPSAELPPLPKILANSKIRIGYLSGEFRHQATSILMVELFEKHDPECFDIFCFDNGWDDGSDIRRRISASVREIVDISGLSDAEAAQSVRDRQINILVNLNGHFGLGRLGVFALRAAPVQVNYLGFPGTIGASYMDYIIADQHVIPVEEQDGYVESVVHMPNSYQVNDRKRAIAPLRWSRGDMGLPSDGFVFCCFNNSYKITPSIFDVWMSLLRRVPGSVLWLLEDSAEASENLRREAEARDVAGARIVFASRMHLDEHLARHALADLFLDTLPYNAHTTASDALWAGLPVLTCRGSTFPGRVATSLLYAVDLPELVTDSLSEYEELAFSFATDTKKLEAIRMALRQRRSSCTLFNTDLFARHLEGAFRIMQERCAAGDRPSFLQIAP